MMYYHVSKADEWAFEVTIELMEGGRFLATCPDLPEVTTFGASAQEAADRSYNAIEEAVAGRKAHGESIPAGLFADAGSS